MSTKELSFTKALRQQRDLQIKPDDNSDEHFIVDSDSHVITQSSDGRLAVMMAKFVSNQGITANVIHKGVITITYVNGVLS